MDEYIKVGTNKYLAKNIEYVRCNKNECAISYLDSDPKKDSKFGPYWKEFSFANGTKDYDDIKSSFNNKPISMFTYGMVDDVSTDKNAYRYNPYWNFSS